MIALVTRRLASCSSSLAVVALVALAALVGAVAAPSASAATATCGTTGTSLSGAGCRYGAVGTDTFVAPYYQRPITFTVYGARSDPSWFEDPGYIPTSWGGMVKGSLAVIPGGTYQVNVGGPATGVGRQYGGFNGGGDAGGAGLTPFFAFSATGGAGASDVRGGGFGLDDRIFVAGGAGGNIKGIGGPMGGQGGGVQGGAGGSADGDGGGGGSQTQAGASPGTAGSAGRGFGGRGGQGVPEALEAGAGGGGGYFGGGGSGSVLANVLMPGAGGGGSSFATPAATGVVSETGGQLHYYADAGPGAPDWSGERDGRGAVLITWSGTPVTATIALSSNRTSPVAPTTNIDLSTKVTTSAGIAPLGNISFVDYTNANGATNPQAPQNCPCYNVTGDILDETQDGMYVKTIRASALRGGPEHAIVATYDDRFGEIARVRSAPVAFRVPMPVPTITAQPVSTSAVHGAVASFTAAASSLAGVTVPIQWERSTDAGVSYQQIPDEEFAELLVLADGVASTGTRYRAVFGDPGNTATTNAATLTVTPAPLTVTARSGSYVYGQTAPSLGADVQGLLSNDPGEVNGTLSCTSSGTAAGAVPGDYPITCSGLSSPDYAISYVAGTLTVRYPAPVCQDITRQSTPAATIDAPLFCAAGYPGDTLTYAITVQPTHGTALRLPGEVQYTPSAGFAGVDSFTYVSTGTGGASVPRTITVTVAGLPQAQIAAPLDGASFALGELVLADYTCTAGSFGGTLVSGAAGCASSVASGDPIDTAAAGSHTFTVVATDGVGNAVTATAGYMVRPAVTTTTTTTTTATTTTDLPAVGGGGTQTSTTTTTPPATCGATSRAGCAGDDRIGGTGSADHISGGSGDDRLAGGAGGDELLGGSGDDLLLGGSGADLLWGGLGDDQLRGGTGSDALHGASGRDRLSGDAGTDRLYGGHGDDLLLGGPGSDRLHGGTGDDRLRGGSGDDQLNGGLGHDVLDCGPGHDIAFADAADVVLASCELVVRVHR